MQCIFQETEVKYLLKKLQQLFYYKRILKIIDFCFDTRCSIECVLDLD